MSVRAGSPAAQHGIAVGDEIVRVNGDIPRDIIEWQLAADDAEIDLDVARGGLDLSFSIEKAAGESLGVEVSSAVFDRVRTCDNHCEFCFIYQLPKGMRSSLYLKDDDYRLSFLYGNFTTLTRFTEADLERVVTERLSPLHVSIHATDPDVRSQMLNNPRGGMSLRWLRALLDHGITVHGQIVVCPGVNDGAVLDDTFAGILDQYPELDSVAIVPLGDLEVQRRGGDAAAHGRRGACGGRRRRRLAGRVPGHARPADGVRRRRVLPDGRPPVPRAGALRRVPDARGRHRHGPHVRGRVPRRQHTATGVQRGLLRLRRRTAEPGLLHRTARPAATWPTRSSGGNRTPARCRCRPVGRHRSACSPANWARASSARSSSRSIAPTSACSPVANEFFGGNTGVTGLMTGEDVSRVLAAQPEGHRYLLPDVCLSDEGRFLDGVTVDQLPRPVEIVPTDGISLRNALNEH